MMLAKSDLIDFAKKRRFATILADPPWQFINRTGKMAPEHRRLSRYATMTLGEISALPVSEIAPPTAHLYLWVPNALLPEGLAVMKAWGFSYKSNIVWHKIRKDGVQTVAELASIFATSPSCSFLAFAEKTPEP
jgi:N6-adenosine-specific RNA methylase IME4